MGTLCSICQEDKWRSQLSRLPSTVSRGLAASKGFYLHVDSILRGIIVDTMGRRLAIWLFLHCLSEP